MLQAWPRRNAILAGVLVLLAGPAPSVGQPGPAPLELAVSGQVEHPRILAIADLQALPPVTLEAAHITSRGVQRGTYTGPLLWALIDAAVPVDEPGGRNRLQHTLLARGRDGYAVALSIGELHPDLGHQQILVAYAQDGQALPALRLVVPGDAHASRNVRDLVAIEVR